MTAKNKYYKKIGIHYEKIMLDPTGRKIKKTKQPIQINHLSIPKIYASDFIST